MIPFSFLPILFASFAGSSESKRASEKGFTEKERQTDRDRGKNTDKHKSRERHIDIEKDKERDYK